MDNIIMPHTIPAIERARERAKHRKLGILSPFVLGQNFPGDKYNPAQYWDFYFDRVDATPNSQILKQKFKAFDVIIPEYEKKSILDYGYLQYKHAVSMWSAAKGAISRLPLDSEELDFFIDIAKTGKYPAYTDSDKQTRFHSFVRKNKFLLGQNESEYRAMMHMFDYFHSKFAPVFEEEKRRILNQKALEQLQKSSSSQVYTYPKRPEMTTRATSISRPGMTSRATSVARPGMTSRATSVSTRQDAVRSIDRYSTLKLKSFLRVIGENAQEVLNSPQSFGQAIAKFNSIGLLSKLTARTIVKPNVSDMSVLIDNYNRIAESQKPNHAIYFPAQRTTLLTSQSSREDMIRKINSLSERIRGKARSNAPLPRESSNFFAGILRRKDEM